MNKNLRATFKPGKEISSFIALQYLVLFFVWSMSAILAVQHCYQYCLCDATMLIVLVYPLVHLPHCH